MMLVWEGVRGEKCKAKGVGEGVGSRYVLWGVGMAEEKARRVRRVVVSVSCIMNGCSESKGCDFW
jgi:hypothetical protein